MGCFSQTAAAWQTSIATPCSNRGGSIENTLSASSTGTEPNNLAQKQPKRLNRVANLWESLAVAALAKLWPGGKKKK